MAPSDKNKNQAQTEIAPKTPAPAASSPAADTKSASSETTQPVDASAEAAAEAASAARAKRRAEIDRIRAENEELYEETELFRAQEESKRLKALKAAAEKAVREDQAAAKEEEPCFRNAKGQLVPERYRGSITYTVKQPHYRGGVYYGVGEKITVTDEKPSRTWERVTARPSPAPAPAAEPEARASDIQV